MAARVNVDNPWKVGLLRLFSHGRGSDTIIRSAGSHEWVERPPWITMSCSRGIRETASVVAEIPALRIADFGADVPEALERLQAMAAFHLDCLVQEGKPIPTEKREDAGFYLRVKPSPDAA